jgi:hypothetical protein
VAVAVMLAVAGVAWAWAVLIAPASIKAAPATAPFTDRVMALSTFGVELGLLRY